MAMEFAIARPELLLVAEAVAREKMIEREEVLEAMEQAIQKAGRAKYGAEKDIRATIDRKNGEVKLSRWTEVVEQEPPENEATQIPLRIAEKFALPFVSVACSPGTDASMQSKYDPVHPERMLPGWAGGSPLPESFDRQAFRPVVFGAR